MDWTMLIRRFALATLLLIAFAASGYAEDEAETEAGPQEPQWREFHFPERGFVASFPFEATGNDYNPNIHTANDTLANFGNNARHAAKFAKLGAAFVAEMAKGELDPELAGNDPGRAPPAP